MRYGKAQSALRYIERAIDQSPSRLGNHFPLSEQHGRALLRTVDQLTESLSSLHSILERVAVEHTDMLTSAEHEQWMEAGALLNRLKSPAASTEK